MKTIRKQAFRLLDNYPEKRGAGRWLDIFLIVLILLNVLVVILDSVESIQQRYSSLFWSFEIFSVVVFSIEYLLRLWTCVESTNPAFTHPLKGRIRWALSPLGLIDLLAILPFYLNLLILPAGPDNWLLLRLIRGLRLLRIFKLSRFSPAMGVLRSVLVAESRTLGVVGFILFVIIIIASWGIYLLENQAQPEAFANIPAAMWWTIVTLTTVGYGDVVPVTDAGKLFAGLISLIGIAMLALPAGILASGFSSEMRHRNEKYRHVLETLLADGKISISEAHELERLRESLGLTPAQAENLLKTAERHLHKRLADSCPHCGEPLHKLIENLKEPKP